MVPLLLVFAPVPILDNGIAIPPICIFFCIPSGIGFRLAGMAFDVDCLPVTPTVERHVADTRYACGNGYAGNVLAKEERAIAVDTRYAFGNGYAAAYSCWNSYNCGFCLVVHYAVLIYEIGIVRVYCYAGKTAAKAEGRDTDRRYVCGNGYTGKVAASVERVLADSRYAFGNGYAGKAGAGERPDANRRYAVGNGYAGKAGATIERTAADRCYAFGDSYASKAGATVEPTDSFKLAAFHKGYAGKAGTTAERSVADIRYACGNSYAGKAGAIPERIVADSGKLAFRRERYAGKGGIRLIICSSKCGVVPSVTAVANCRYGQVGTACVGAVVGGYNYCPYGCAIAGVCIVDAVGVIGAIIDTDKIKIKPCRAGGVFTAEFCIFGVCIVVFACYYFYAVRCFGSGYCRIGGVPIVRVRVYGCASTCFSVQ